MRKLGPDRVCVAFKGVHEYVDSFGALPYGKEYIDSSGGPAKPYGKDRVPKAPQVLEYSPSPSLSSLSLPFSPLTLSPYGKDPRSKGSPGPLSLLLSFSIAHLGGQGSPPPPRLPRDKRIQYLRSVVIPRYLQAELKGADGLGFVKFGAVTGISEAPWTGTSDTHARTHARTHAHTHTHTHTHTQTHTHTHNII
jgi:hypothetical protein